MVSCPMPCSTQRAAAACSAPRRASRSRWRHSLPPSGGQFHMAAARTHEQQRGLEQAHSQQRLGPRPACAHLAPRGSSQHEQVAQHHHRHRGDQHVARDRGDRLPPGGIRRSPTSWRCKVSPSCYAPCRASAGGARGGCSKAAVVLDPDCVRCLGGRSLANSNLVLMEWARHQAPDRPAKTSMRTHRGCSI
jgi:hypothetical protein